ncbi:hypothetical protein HanRHA438_Chr05g0237351 [Helianthus annuus]|nr:hypothetical protein HanRHA438_Chr05g0237351 [Helianthus annuus]
MPLFAANTQYSLVEGERIVRFVFNEWVRFFSNFVPAFLKYWISLTRVLYSSDVGQTPNTIFPTFQASRTLYWFYIMHSPNCYSYNLFYSITASIVRGRCD